MATIAAICAALTRIGFSTQTATFLTDVQGFDSLNKFKVLTDDEVDRVGSVLRKPGGTIMRDGNQVTTLEYCATPIPHYSFSNTVL